MKCSRRDLINAGPAAGVLLGAVGSRGLSAQNQSRASIPRARAGTLVSLFGLKYPIFEAPHGLATGLVERLWRECQAAK